jgi:predicted DCC family thiol-disulfide oxidoreductase YuxK
MLKQIPMQHINENQSIVLFDGVCNLCNSAVAFIIKRDKKKIFKLSPLQSSLSEELNQQFHFKQLLLNSIVLIENNKVFYKSTAALRVVKRLSGPIKFLYIFIIVPPFIRDAVYSVIAKNRYRWFGKKSCEVTNV